MKKLLVKVCGLRESANITAINALGVDMLGFIFYPPSPRFVEAKATASEIRKLESGAKKTGVFVNETLANILDKAAAYGLDSIQLHGQEIPDMCALLKIKFTVLKAFPVATADDFNATKDYEGVCDYFIFDTKGPQHGGNGVAFDWNMLEHYTGNTPFFLSGGISPDDAEKIATLNHPKLAGVDLNSRFETEPGVKNVEALRKFLNVII